MRFRQFQISSVLLLGVSLLGCDGDRLQQFSSFASLGSAYVTSIHGLVRETGSAMIASDSATLIRARELATPAGVASDKASFEKQLKDSNVQLKQYLETLQKLDSHASRLGAYFKAISQLADSKHAAEFSASADALVQSIDDINPVLEKLSVGDKKVADYIKPTSRLVVAHFQVRALDQRLEKDAPIIDRALAIQQAALEALSAQSSTALQATVQMKEGSEVIGPYVANKPLPSVWTKRRENFLRAKVTLESAEGAKEASGNLRDCFRELVAKKEGSLDFHSLMQAISQLNDYVTELGAMDSSSE